MATSRLEHQLLDRARYIKALAVAMGSSDTEKLADRLIEAHSATVEWLTTVLAEDALGGPAALQRTPLQTATGVAVKLVNVPMSWSAKRLDRAVDTVRSAPPALGELLSRGAHAGDVAAKALSASRDAALATAERITRREGADQAADALHSMRSAAGVLEADELPITDYDDLNVSEAVAAIKELTTPSDVRAILAYEEAHKEPSRRRFRRPDARRGHRTRGRRHRLTGWAPSPIPDLDIPAVNGDRGDIRCGPAETVSAPAAGVLDRR